MKGEKEEKMSLNHHHHINQCHDLNQLFDKNILPLNMINFCKEYLPTNIITY